MSNSYSPHAIRRLPWSEGSAETQLAGSTALLANLEQSAAPAMRWYRIIPPTLLLGAAQRPAEIDAAACAAAGIPVYRRGSGGGVVLSDPELLMLDVALPHDDPRYHNDVTESYRWLGAVWVAALRDLGLAASLVPVQTARADTQALDALTKRVCFGGLSPYEVIVGERKVVGLAQIRRRPGALYQAGVYLHWAPSRTAELLAATASERAALSDRLAARVAGLAELLGQPPDPAVVMSAFEAALARTE